MGDGGMALRPVRRPDCWRVEMAWPKRNPRYFGRFDSRAEAEKWIKEHRWVADQAVRDSPVEISKGTTTLLSD